MDITVMCHGRNIEIPDPTTHSYLGGFVESLNSVRDVQTGKLTESLFTTCDPVYRNKLLVGHMAITKKRMLDNEQIDDPLVPISGQCSHVALMRHKAELVVTYEKQRKALTDGVHYCAVFKPVEEADDYFAQSEPPAHDSWEYRGMTDTLAKSCVRVALRKMKQLWHDHTTLNQTKNDTGSDLSLIHI